MQSEYKSPRDKSIVAGNGLNSISSFNEASNYPAYGTFLRTIDTSRYEFDFLNNQFWMPYSVSYYADGLGGEYSTAEVFGLQYLPAGWVTNSGSDDNVISWDFLTSQYQQVAGSVAISWTAWNDIEDGTGINTRTPVNGGSYHYDGDTLSQYHDGYTYRWYVYLYSGNAYFVDYTMYPPYGTSSGQSTGNATLEISGYGEAIAGTSYYNDFSDGYGGNYSQLQYTYWSPGGTTLAVWNENDNTSYDPDIDVSYPNGTYNYTTAIMNESSPYGDGTYRIEYSIGGSYYSYGTAIRNIWQEDSYTSWANLQFNNGKYIGTNRVWDGTGSFTNLYYEGGEWFTQGTQIGNYYNDQNGNYYDLQWDGSGGIIESLNNGGGENYLPYGTFIGTGCGNGDMGDSLGNWWYNHPYIYGEFYADGNGGSYFSSMGSNANGCYYPQGFVAIQNSGEGYLSWYFYDTCGAEVSSGSVTYSGWSEGQVANGYGGWDYWYSNWGTPYGTVYYESWYTDMCDSSYNYFKIFSDGSDGYFTERYSY